MALYKSVIISIIKIDPDSCLKKYLKLEVFDRLLHCVLGVRQLGCATC